MKMPVIKLLRLPWRWWRRFSIPTVTNRLEVCADTSPTEEVGLDLRKGTSLVLFDRLEQPRLWAFYSHRGNSIGLVKPLLLSLYQMPLQVRYRFPLPILSRPRTEHWSTPIPSAVLVLASHAGNCTY